MSLIQRSALVRYAIASLLVRSSVGFVISPATTTTWNCLHSSTNKHILWGSVHPRCNFQLTSLRYSRSSLSSENGDSNTSFNPSTSGASAVRSQRPIQSDADQLQMISFYKFAPVPNPAESRDALFDSICEIPGLRGSIYLAQEGINAQMAVPEEYLDSLLKACSSNLPFDPFDEVGPNLGDIVPSSTPTFDRLIVRTRDYVLRDGIDSEIALDWNNAGPELDASEWHEAVMSGPALLDCRNLYESNQGTFRGAIPLKTDTFQDSWSQLDGMTKDLKKDEPVYIFCTGGIRCVKVGAYLKQHLGFDNVKRLKHGIIGYQKWAEENDEPSAWEGENFLFDKRRFEEKEEEKDMT